MSAVGETPNGLEFIRISSHIPKNIQEGIADIIFEDNDILSHPTFTPWIIVARPSLAMAGLICPA